MTASRRLSRRSFLGTTALGTSALFCAPAILKAKNANDRLNLAFIGSGGRGARNLKTMTDAGNDNVVALCDVDSRNLGRAAEKFSSARKYADFRKLLDEASDIDAVVVSTPEHTHAYATLPALQLGKHVYCEKPLTQNVQEARIVAQAASQAKVATQMGTQIHAGDNYRRVVELIRSGAIGPVHEVHVWVSRAWGLQSKEEAEANHDLIYVTERPQTGMPVPEYLNWDLWLGPARERPFHEAYFPGPKWYRWWDFGNGTMSDLGSHWVDLPFWALELDAPLTIESHGGKPHPEIAPASMTAHYEYGPRGDSPACTLTWYQGTHKPAKWTSQEIPQWKNGVLFVGKEGMLLADYAKYVLLPEKQFADFVPPEPFLPRSPGQHEEWLLACKNGTPTGSPFSYAAALTEANHLGNVAYRAGQKIEWDSKNMRIPNSATAEQFLSRMPRHGWSLET